MACRKFLTNSKLLSLPNQRYLSTSCSLWSASKDSSSRDDVKDVTHTGQVYAPEDYRNVRFTNAARQVNKNWGINLIDEIPPKECTDRVVWCDGGDENLGHPKVYINLDKPGVHACGYCGLRYVKKDHHH